MNSTLSVLGLYNYDNTLFDKLHLPEGVDKEEVVGSILMECAELEILYTNPIVMCKAIGLWSRVKLRAWEKLYATTNFEYNPIHNYDRKELWSDVEKENYGRNRDGITNEDNKQESGGTNTEKVSAFDSNSFVNRGETVSELNGESKMKQQFSVNEEEDRDSTITHTSSISGNIGVTTTQKMIEDERKVVRYSVVEEIVKDFKARFCLMVY